MTPERRGKVLRRNEYVLAAALALAAWLVGARVEAQPRTPGCERCHGELELLRQQAGNLNRAQALLVPQSVVASSAHGDMKCDECHSAFERYPHPKVVSTKTCTSCHAVADSAWRTGAHATADEPVTCAQCHTQHDIKPAHTLSAKHGAQLANAPCISCHQTQTPQAHTAHADSVSCSGCHGPHAVRPADDPESWLTPARQATTCAACHDSVRVTWSSDIHGNEALRRTHTSPGDSAATVVCTSCHQGHHMLPTDNPGFGAQSVERCAACHEHEARTYRSSYHGKATTLGSGVAATCADCHGAHTILPDSMSASLVSGTNLIDTCAECHEYARAAFVKYDAHPDPFNRARNPWIFYSFWFMNGLLIFVLIVFGSHTLLWWIRILLDRKKAEAAAQRTGKAA